MKRKRIRITAIVLTLTLLLTIIPVSASSNADKPKIGTPNMLGDIDGDGVVTIFDVIYLLCHLVEMPPDDPNRDPGKTHPQVGVLNSWVLPHACGGSCPNPAPNGCHKNAADCTANRCPNIKTSCHNTAADCVANRCTDKVNGCHRKKIDCDDVWELTDQIRKGNQCPKVKGDCEADYSALQDISDKYTEKNALLAAANAIIDSMLCQDCGGSLDDVCIALQGLLDESRAEVQELKDRVQELESNPIIRDCTREHCETGKCRQKCELNHCPNDCALPNQDYLGESSGPLPVDPNPQLLPPGASYHPTQRVRRVNLTTHRNKNGQGSTGSWRFEDIDGNAVSDTNTKAPYRLRIRRGGTYIITGAWSSGQLYIDARETHEDAYESTDYVKNYIVCDCSGKTTTKPGCSQPTKAQLDAPGYNGHWTEIDDPDPAFKGKIIVPTRHRLVEPVKIILYGAQLTANAQGPAILERRSAGVTLVIQDVKEYSSDSILNVLGDTKGVVYPNIIREDEEDPNIEPNGTVYMRGDLTITGRGTLTVNGNFRHGIISRDNITIDGGDIRVNTNRGATINIPVLNLITGKYEKAEEDTDTTKVGNCIHGRDSITINGGTFRLNAGRHGLRTDNIMNTRKSTTNRYNKATDSGFIRINGGRFLQIHAPNGTAIRAAVPEMTATVNAAGDIQPYSAGAGGGTKIEARAIFDYTVERQSIEEDEEVEPEE
ncbi:MAG: carbohydrate-binding domain-containing protein [Oscillospiraceae bacterium]|nr:carbohydrate-binding domain-containing protein [Oscillospiraceae bacterium]